MRRFRFVCERHEDHGCNGWRPTNQPSFDPLTGMAVAHDCLEHFPDGDESPQDEFQALGCAIWLRGETGVMTDGRNSDLAGHLASEFPDVLKHVIHGNLNLYRNAPAVRLNQETRELLQRINNKALAGVREEFDASNGLRDLVQRGVGWMAVGYRRAVRRFRRYNQWELGQMFVRIQEEADKQLKWAEEGTVLNVQLNLRRYDVMLWTEEPAYDY